MRRLFSSFAVSPLNAELNPICHLLALLDHPILHISRIRVKVQVFYAYVMTGLIIVLYILILVFFFKSFDFISFELAWSALLPFAILSAISMSFCSLWMQLHAQRSLQKPAFTHYKYQPHMSRMCIKIVTH
jgi:hypothetical protein